MIQKFFLVPLLFLNMQALSAHQLLEISASYAPSISLDKNSTESIYTPSKNMRASFGGLSDLDPKNGFRPICGPAPSTNTIICFDISKKGVYSKSFPIPGQVSSTPIFFNGYWIFGTTKGFLLKVSATNQNLPDLFGDNIAYWGSHSRDMMAHYFPKTNYTDSANGDSKALPALLHPELNPKGTSWVFFSAGEFLGTPLVNQKAFYGISANGYVQALDFRTGKLLWAVRLAPHFSLEQQTDSLALTSDGKILVGNSFGELLLLSIEKGDILWSWQLPHASEQERSLQKLPITPDKYSGIIARPLVYGENKIIISNAVDMTQGISLRERRALWNYPLGSVVPPLLYQEKNVILASSQGDVVSLNAQTGTPVWVTHLSQGHPLLGTFIVNDIMYASNDRGEIFALNAKSGAVLAHHLSTGQVTGNFFQGPEKYDACLSFSSGGFRCYRLVPHEI